INHIVPIKAPLIPAIEGVDDEKLVKNDGVKCPAPFISVSMSNAANTSKPTIVQAKKAHLLTLFVVNLPESFFSTVCWSTSTFLFVSVILILLSETFRNPLRNQIHC